MLIFPDPQIGRADTALGRYGCASVMISPAPPTARLPKCTRCQLLAKPSTLEYSHMGDTTIRFLNSILFILRGEKRCGMLLFLYKYGKVTGISIHGFVIYLNDGFKLLMNENYLVQRFKKRSNRLKEVESAGRLISL
jgi:hypothetical protein